MPSPMKWLALGLLTILSTRVFADPLQEARASRSLADQKVVELRQALETLTKIHNELRDLVPYGRGIPYSEKHETTIVHIPAWAELTEDWLLRKSPPELEQEPVRQWAERWRQQFIVTQKASREFVVLVNRGYYALEQLPAPIRAASNLIMGVRYDLVVELECEKPGIYRRDGKVCYPQDILDQMRCAVSLAETAVLTEIAVTKTSP